MMKMQQASQKPDYEVKIVIKKKLSKEERDFITNTIDEIAKRYGMYLHADHVTYSKLPPLKSMKTFQWEQSSISV